MTYLDVYFSRLNHSGETTAERVRNNGIRSFERWLAESPHTVENLSVERGIYFSGILTQYKDKEYQKLLHLHVANDIPIQVGDIMNWRQNDATLEKWIILSEEKKVNGTYRSFDVIKCNYLVKWVDDNGHLQKSWAYVLSSTDDKIKGNYRTWHNLISPQPNKYAELIMPRVDISRGTNFIIEDENWQLIEYDYTSVQGIIYLSVTENKVNLIYDDLEQDIADTDKIAQYRLDLPDVQQVFFIGEEIAPVCTVMKNGVPYDTEILWDSSDTRIARVYKNKLWAIAPGTITVTATLKNFPQISQSVEVTIEETESEIEFSAYIEGNDTIKLDRYCSYKLVGTLPVQDVVQFSLDETELAEISEVEDNNCVIHANKKNKLGTISLKALYNGVEYIKDIKIVPLW